MFRQGKINVSGRLEAVADHGSLLRVRSIEDFDAGEVDLLRHGELAVEEPAQEGVDRVVDADVAGQLEVERRVCVDERLGLREVQPAAQEPVGVVREDAGDLQAAAGDGELLDHGQREAVRLVAQDADIWLQALVVLQKLCGLRGVSVEKRDVPQQRVQTAVARPEDPAVEEEDLLLPGEVHAEVQEQERLAGAGAAGEADERRRGSALPCQELQDLLLELRLLIREKIFPPQEPVRIRHRGDQVVRRAEAVLQLPFDAAGEGRALQLPQQLRHLRPREIAAVVQTVERVRLRHVGVGEDRAGDVGQVVAVLLQLLPDPVLGDGGALQLDIEHQGPVRRQLQEIELLADVPDRIGEAESVEKRQEDRSRRGGLLGCRRIRARLCRAPVSGICSRLLQGIRQGAQRGDLMRAETLRVLTSGQRPFQIREEIFSGRPGEKIEIECVHGGLRR